MRNAYSYMRVFVWGLFVFLMLFCIATNPFANTSAGDSAFFSYMGRRWCEGYVPYRDYFDHKGPMIFFINMLGQLPGHYYFFLWLIECIVAVSGIIMINRFCKKFFSGVDPLAVQLPVAALIWSFFSTCYGNMTEWYAYVFIMYVLFSCLKNILHARSATIIEALLYGASFMVVFLLRANMVMVAFVVAVWYVAELLRTKEWRRFLLNSIATVMGMFAILVPFIVYFYLKGALYDAYYASILYNIRYAGQNWHWTWCFYPVAGTLIINAVMCLIEKDVSMRRAARYNLLFVVLTSAILFKMPFYSHYFVMIVPGVVLPLAWLLRVIGNTITVSAIVAIPSFAVLAMAVLGANLDVGGYIAHLKRGGGVLDVLDFKEGSQYNELHKFTPLIKDKTSVLVYGAECGIYQYLNVSGRFKYYGHTVGEALEYDPSIKVAILDHIEQQRDRYVIVSKRTADASMLPRIAKGYDSLCETEHYALFEKKSSTCGKGQ